MAKQQLGPLARHHPRPLSQSERGVRRRWPDIAATLRHLWWFRDRHYRRWRLETFGLYAPSLPHERPWWRISPVTLVALLRLLPGYLDWVRRMRLLRQGSAEVLWRSCLSPESAVRWQAWHLEQHVAGQGHGDGCDGGPGEQ